VDLSPTRGHEQAGRRPVLVVSEDLFNRGPAGLVIVLPMTSTLRNVPTHVALAPPEGGVKNLTAILCDGIRSVSVERLVVRWGTVGPRTMATVEDRLRILLRL
jgi:mRNA interferase MazF